MPKILLVEDERSIAEGLKVSLESEGFQVGWAKDGNEALAAWDRTRPDLIVLPTRREDEGGGCQDGSGSGEVSHGDGDSGVVWVWGAGPSARPCDGGGISHTDDRDRRQRG